MAWARQPKVEVDYSLRILAGSTSCGEVEPGLAGWYQGHDTGPLRRIVCASLTHELDLALLEGARDELQHGCPAMSFLAQGWMP